MREAFVEPVVELWFRSNRISYSAYRHCMQWYAYSRIGTRKSCEVVILAILRIVFLVYVLQYVIRSPVIDNLGKSKRDTLLHLVRNHDVVFVQLLDTRPVANH